MSKKIILCTNSFSRVTNGPARFANLFYNSNKTQNLFTPYIITEDFNEGNLDRFFKLKLSNYTQNNLFSQLFRNYYYFVGQCAYYSIKMDF